jgi:[ribosomal protein S5]-alanine N-acetyltransferase
MEIRGLGLSLRLPRDDDAAALLALAGDPEVTRWFSWGPYASLDEPVAYLARLPGQRERGEQLDLLVVDDDRGPAGILGLSEFSARDRRAVVGTWLGRAFWGTGVNAKAKALALKLAFDELGLERVGAYTNPENGRSIVALERLGLVREGTLRSFHRHGTQRHDVHVFGLLREAWLASPLASVEVEVRGEVPAAFRVGGPPKPQ